MDRETRKRIEDRRRRLQAMGSKSSRGETEISKNSPPPENANKTMLSVIISLALLGLGIVMAVVSFLLSSK